MQGHGVLNRFSLGVDETGAQCARFQGQLWLSTKSTGRDHPGFEPPRWTGGGKTPDAAGARQPFSNAIRHREGPGCPCPLMRHRTAPGTSFAGRRYACWPEDCSNGRCGASCSGAYGISLNSDQRHCRPAWLKLCSGRLIVKVIGVSSDASIFLDRRQASSCPRAVLGSSPPVFRAHSAGSPRLPKRKPQRWPRSRPLKDRRQNTMAPGLLMSSIARRNHRNTAIGGDVVCFSPHLEVTVTVCRRRLDGIWAAVLFVIIAGGVGRIGAKA